MTVSSLPRFTISPGSANGPAPVTLTLPSNYSATASLTDDCGKPIPGATLTVTGHTATPQYPASFAGTAFVAWRIVPAGHQIGVHTVMTMAARETIGGKATTCPPSGGSPYQAAAQPPAEHALTVTAASGTPPAAYGVAGAALVTVLAIAAVAFWWRRRRPRAAIGRHR